ncbi:hypothetical protein D3C74_282600 [compost metagenome]
MGGGGIHRFPAKTCFLDIIRGLVHCDVRIASNIADEAGHILNSFIASFQVLQLGMRPISQLNRNIHAMLSSTVRCLCAGRQLLRGRSDLHRGVIDLSNQVAQVHCHIVEVAGQRPDFILVFEEKRFMGKVALGNGVHRG